MVLQSRYAHLSSEAAQSTNRKNVMISEEEQLAMFGTKICVLDEAIATSDDPLMLAMQMMSDAQEEMQRGNDELARQFINRSKHVVDAVRHARETRFGDSVGL